MSEEMTMHERIEAQLPDEVELMFVDYRDELPDEFYSTMFREGREAWMRVLEDVETWYDRIEAAYHVVDEAARAAGYYLSSPFVSIDPDEHWNLVETVLMRDTSDAESIVRQLARRDTVLLGFTVSDEWYSYDADAGEVAAEFGEGLHPDWMQLVVAQGEGHPVVLFTVDGADLAGFFHALYGEPESNPDVRIYYQDAGLLNRMSGSGWIEDLPEQRTMTVPLDEFLARTWVDNDPRASTSWTAITGGARAAAPGGIELLPSDRLVSA